MHLDDSYDELDIDSLFVKPHYGQNKENENSIYQEDSDMFNYTAFT